MSDIVMNRATLADGAKAMAQEFRRLGVITEDELKQLEALWTNSRREITFPPEMLPTGDGEAEVFVCEDHVGDGPCPNCQNLEIARLRS